MTSRKTSAAALLATMLLGVTATSVSAKDYAQETTNLINFHLIDFIGWSNGNMDVMRKYHGSKVLVNIIGSTLRWHRFPCHSADTDVGGRGLRRLSSIVHLWRRVSGQLWSA